MRLSFAIVPNILVYALTATPERIASPELREFAGKLASCPFSGTVERALWGGFHADRLAQAFVAGYGAALRKSFESAGILKSSWLERAQAEGRLASMAATEAGGAHPRAIATRLDKRGGDLLLSGEKTFATLATVADDLLVVASRGFGTDGRNRLRMVRVSTRAPGVTIEERAPMPFAPELPHAKVRFHEVNVHDADVLPGDGYGVWLKPFRTQEDVHVLAATVGYLLGVARNAGWEQSLRAELTSLALSLVDLGARDASLPLSHVVLQGLYAQVQRLVAGSGAAWETAPADERARFERDRALLGVADGVRRQRDAAAFDALTGGGGAVSTRP